MKIGILGSGDVAKALAGGFLKYGHEVMLGTRTAGKLADWAQKNPKARTGGFDDAAKFGELVVLAVKGTAASAAMRTAGPTNLAGKTMMDATNPIADAAPVNGVLKFFTSLDESLMERLQKEFPREVWVFTADEAQRQVELSGLAAIDPSRTELPEEWRPRPAILVEPGGSLALAEVRRGEAEPPPDALTLSREIWLDPDGRAASVRDHFGGTLRSTTRLDILPPGAVGRIAVDGQDQLVTAHPETKAAGVELRSSALQLEADSRLALKGGIPAVGWTTGVEQIQATLHVPPGWSLLGSARIDRLPGTWTSQLTDWGTKY